MNLELTLELSSDDRATSYNDAPYDNRGHCFLLFS